MKIIKLFSENIKRLKAIEIAPKGDVVVIGGNNNQGKSSVLDSIAYALAGGGAVCEEPVRRGEAKAKIVCELDDYIVTRTFTAAGGGTLTITSKDGKQKFTGPQGMLDKIAGKLSFDPLEFSRQIPDKQLETLRGLLGLDFTKIDQGRAAASNERTIVNRNVKALEARLAASPEHKGIPEAEVSMSALVSEIEKAQAHNSEIAEKDNRRGGLLGLIENRKQEIAGDRVKIKELKEEIIALEQDIASLEQEMSDLAEDVKQIEQSIAATKPIDLAPIRKQISEADGINQKVRQNAAREQIASDLARAQKESSSLTARIEAMDKEKVDAITSAKFPVSGLGLGEGGVTFNGIPLSQCSSSEQLKVSLAMGIALNPKLKVMLIRDGSLLDDASMKVVAEMAAVSGTQVWIEKVSTDAGQCQVIIEDGEVREEVAGA